MTGRKRVVVGMSGGVDSSVTAGLLVEQGYDVVGITLNLWPELDGAPENAREDACCALGAVEDARRVADRLGIRYYVMNFRDVFEEKVIKDFIGTQRYGGSHEAEGQQERAEPGHCAACGADLAARRGAPTRIRRSVSDRKPAKAMSKAPSQISVI